MRLPSETAAQSAPEDDEGARMFITIRYGNNETLLCNPSCAIVNLLASIKRRTGYGNTDMMLDLSDETGLVKDLDHHKYDYATKFLNTHATYVLLEKHLAASSSTGDLTVDVDLSGAETDAGGGGGGTSTPSPPQYTYTPLLEHCHDHFPGFRLHVAPSAAINKKKKMRSQSKSPSPAGMRPTKTAKGKPAPNRTPSKRR